MAIDTGFVIVYFSFFPLLFRSSTSFPMLCSQKWSEHISAIKNRDLFTLFKLENELHEATRFVIRQEIVVKKKSENQLKEKKLRLRVFRFLELSPSHLIDYCGE